MSDVPVEEHLSLLLTEKEQQLLQDHTALIIEKGCDDCLSNGGGLRSKEWDGLIEVDLIFEFVVVGLEVVEVLVVDDADDNLVVLDGDSSAWGWIYRLMAYFQRVDTTSSQFLLYPYSTVFMSMEAFHLASKAVCSSSQLGQRKMSLLGSNRMGFWKVYQRSFSKALQSLAIILQWLERSASCSLSKQYLRIWLTPIIVGSVMLQLLFRMKEGSRLEGPHVIRLQNRRVEVQLEYHSPPKKDRLPKVCEIDLCRPVRQREDGQRASRKIIQLNSFKSIKKMQLVNTSPFYYLKAIEESQPIVADYEKFHQRMVGNETQPPRLKVYSNSKELKTAKENIFSKVTGKQGTSSKPIKETTNTHVPLRKIKLYSPLKSRPQQKSNSAALKQKSGSLPNSSFPHHIKLKGTPQRRHKLQVTSSKSRNKQDSMISRDQKSIEAGKQVKFRMEEETPSRFLQSFHSMSLHEH